MGTTLDDQGESTIEPQTNPFLNMDTETPALPAVEVSDFAKGVLKGVPEHLLPELAPFVATWDKGVQDLLAKTKSQYGEIDPQAARDALELQQLIESNPKEAIRLLTETYGQDEEPQTSEPTIDNATLARLAELENTVKQLTQKEMAEKAHIQEQVELAEFDKLLSELGVKDTPAEEFVVYAIANGKDPKEAADSIKALQAGAAKNMLQEHDNAPPVLGGSSFTPGTDNIPVGQMSEKDRRAFVAKMLQ